MLTERGPCLRFLRSQPRGHRARLGARAVTSWLATGVAGRQLKPFFEHPDANLGFPPQTGGGLGSSNLRPLSEEREAAERKFSCW